MPTKKAEAETVETAPVRKILVFQGKKSFVITVPEDAKTTFGPWVPPSMRSTDAYGRSHGSDSMGTLRVYGRTEKHILGVFSGVTGFRDLSLEYVEVEADMLGGVEEEPETEIATAGAIFFTSDGTSAPAPVGRRRKKRVLVSPADRVVDPDEKDLPF
jgi:hypothetical protein